MKPKEFIEKYNLSNGWNPKVQNEFIQDLTSELLAFLEYNKAANNIKGFDNSVKVIRMKWDAISNKIPYGLPNKLWNYFYATVVVRLMKEVCPEDIARRRVKQEQRRREYEERKQSEQAFWNRLFGGSIYDHIAFMFAASLNAVPVESFQYLGLDENADREAIQKRYRELSLKAHPDRGGSQEKFICLTEHKNKCLKWAARKEEKNV